MKTGSMTLSKADADKALVSPVAIFDRPSEVIETASLTAREKIEILKRWELDARALQRAADESMGGGEPTLLDEVNQALLLLDPEDSVNDNFGTVATKI